MGDLSAEPSMEEILSSIKRIIAEEGEAPGRQRRQPARTTAAKVAALPDPDFDDQEDEVLELSEPMAETAAAAPAEPARAPAGSEPVAPAAPPAAQPAASPQAAAAEPVVSREAAAATRGSLEALTRLMVKPEPASDGTLEGLVREMLRPMLREWIDAHLPAMVEAMVAGEIARITGSSR